MRIVYTKHAKKKFTDLKKLGIFVSEKLVGKIIRNPIDTDEYTDVPKIIVSGLLDDQHVLRVVYREENDIITIITFYPAKKGRYFV